MQHTSVVVSSLADWLPYLGSGVITGTSYVGIRLLSDEGVLPEIVVTAVDSPAAWIVVPGLALGLPALLKFILNFRQQTGDQRSAEERDNQAKIDAMARQWQQILNTQQEMAGRLLTIQREQLERVVAENTNLHSIVDGRDLTIAERDSTIARLMHGQRTAGSGETPIGD